MLWTVSNKLQVDMFISSSNENLYMDIKGVKLKFKKDRLKILVEQSILEKLTYNMKPPHCRTRKCQELNQLLSS
jgi:hypothetical protein